jgi:hypothetical protein
VRAACGENPQIGSSRGRSRRMTGWQWSETKLPVRVDAVVICDFYLQFYPPPGGHRLNITDLLGFSERSHMCQPFFHVQFFPELSSVHYQNSLFLFGSS